MSDFKNLISSRLLFSLILAAFLTAVVPAALHGQSSPGNRSALNLSGLNLGPNDPVPYSPDEFPRGLQDLRRFEQIFIGSFPLSVFFAQLLGFVGLSIQNGIANRDLEGTDSGIEFGSESWKLEDKVRVLSAGVGISFGIAIIDALLYHTRRKEEAERYKRKRMLRLSEEENAAIETDSLPPDGGDDPGIATGINF